MLARKSTIKHPNGLDFTTPMLVPSFSSKGFQFDKKDQSEAKELAEFAAEFLTDQVLFSAYDIKYGHVPEVKDCGFAELVFIDSGGYETNDVHDLSAVLHFPSKIRDWNKDLLTEVLDSWPDESACVIVSYDHGKERHDMKSQIDSARELFSKYPHQLHDFLIKPETSTQYTLEKALTSVFQCIDQLSDFHIIGVTEKELGNSLLSRMTALAELRLGLDTAGVKSPIHVFGSLDPFSSCLYYLAGAEVFDGLTWLRYSYFDGTAIYNSNYGAIRLSIRMQDRLIRQKAIVDNYYYLVNMKDEMQKFLLEGDFSKFTYIGAKLEEHYEMLRTKIEGID